MRRVAGGIVVATGLAASGMALAGDGTLVPVLNQDGRIQKVVVSTKVYVDLPRSQAELDEIEEQMRSASKMICDYTDGLISLENVHYVNGPGEKANADILWSTNDANASASRLAAFGLECRRGGEPCVQGTTDCECPSSGQECRKNS